MSASRLETVNSLLQRTLRPRIYKDGARKGIIGMPGNTYTEAFYPDTMGSYMWDLIDPFQIPLASTAQSTTWGNDAKVGHMGTLLTNAQSSLFASGKVHLLGGSAGATSCLRFAKANPTLVQSLALFIPAVDIQFIYDTNPGGFGFDSQISTAYGGRPSDAQNPATSTPSFTSFPIKIWYSDNDPICTPSSISTFAAAVGATTVSMGSLGHGYGPPLSGRSIGAFFAAND